MDRDSATVGDAWGNALLDHHFGRPVADMFLEVDDGTVVPAMPPEWFFRPFDQWDWWDRELLPLADRGPVLDLGAGAGRASLYFQERGFDVTAVEASPGAAEVCRRRGVVDVREVDLNEPPTDREWGTVLLMCGNLGLGGTWEGNRWLLTRLAELSSPGARLIGDSVDYDGRLGVSLRLRYRDQVTPWWRQYNVPTAQIPELVAGTGWDVERHVQEGVNHAVVLRRRPIS